MLACASCTPVCRPGIEPESGQPYRVDDPDLLLWVHCTEVESFLTTYRRSGGQAGARRRRPVRGRDAGQRAAGRTGPASMVPATEAEIDDYYRRSDPSCGSPRWRCATCSGGSRRRCRAGSAWPPRPGRPGPAWSRWRRRCCRPGPAGCTGCPACRRPTSARASAGGWCAIFRLAGSGGLMRSPAHRAAQQRVA